MARQPDRMPRRARSRVDWFDRFAGLAARMVSRAWFFGACVALVVVWAPSYFLFGDVDTWQLVINTATTIVTFLLVALLQNTQQRSDQAGQHKLNAVAAALSQLLSSAAVRADGGGDRAGCEALLAARRELRAAVGSEERELP